MCEAFGIHIAPSLLLHAVVAHHRRGTESFFDIASLEVATLCDSMRPHARMAIGLQFHRHA